MRQAECCVCLGGALGVESVGFSGLPVWFPRRQLGSSGAAFTPVLTASLPGETVASTGARTTTEPSSSSLWDRDGGKFSCCCFSLI